ncbi:Na+/H+ antiporter NhaA [Caulobacter sp. KR2-114]|uniref:Na+/H+ antiporter NhaA n=1 Tax=Caulobacter sp. KR2-114 TaxID=3400912 RepID=UPI003C0FBE3A
MARRLTLDFVRTASGSGLLLAAAALLAVIWANSPFAPRYFGFIQAEIPVRVGSFALTKSVGHWVSDALMPVFFLVLGMQAKFEVLRGELSSPRRLALPLAAALGGLLVPALTFLALNLGVPRTAGGWATPMATDMGVAMAVLSVAAPRLPPPLRIFLLTVSLADTLVAVVVNGALFAGDVHWKALAGAGLALGLLAVMGWWRRAPFLFYAAGFVVVWAFTIDSGVSTALAGVACGLTVPIGARRPGQDSMLTYFMDSMHPYVAYAVLPLFAFTSAGFAFRGHSPDQLLAPAPLGVGLGLLLGKPLGVFGFSLLAAVLRIGRRPTGVTWLELLGVGFLSGIGFTMSLFVGFLAFGDDPLARTQVRLAVIAASVVAAGLGGALLAMAERRRADLGDDAF